MPLCVHENVFTDRVAPSAISPKTCVRRCSRASSSVSRPAGYMPTSAHAVPRLGTVVAPVHGVFSFSAMYVWPLAPSYVMYRIVFDVQ